MGRQLWLADVLADAFRGVAGYRVETYPSWASRGRSSFEPIGLINHHTGGGGTYDNILRYMLEVSSIKPSCNWATSPPIDGVVRVTICCAGSANHAGRGGAGRGGTPWLPTDTGNLHTLGGEHHNDGSAAWPGQQVEGVEIASAAMLRQLGVGADRAALHKTYAPGRKPDMHTIDLAAHQRGIARYLNPPPPSSAREDDLLMAAAKDDNDARKALIRLWFHTFLGRGPSSSAERDGHLWVFGVNGADACLAGITDSAEAKAFRTKRGW